MEISKEQKEAIECLEKYTKLETYGERNLEKDIITVLELLKEIQKKLEIVNDYNYWVLLSADRGIELKKLQKENEELEKINNELEAEKNEAIRRYNFETIPIKKIKDKIEYLKDYIEENSEDEGYFGNINPDVIYGQIEILEKILKESEE